MAIRKLNKEIVMEPPAPGTIYKIVLFYDTKHIPGGSLTHLATYTCGFWRTLQDELIALHRDVKSWQLWE